jgi:hypothetical protein
VKRKFFKFVIISKKLETTNQGRDEILTTTIISLTEGQEGGLIMKQQH